MSDERRTSDELGNDVRTTSDAIKGTAKGVKKTVNAVKKAPQKAKKVAKQTKKAAKAAAKAAKAAAQAAQKVFEAIGNLIAATFPWSLIVLLALFFLVMIIYLVVNSPIFNVITKLFAGPSVDDIREYISNTQNDPDDWRFSYNKMLPEEQYDYIYNGNDPSQGDEGKEVFGLADYILQAYLDARKAFEQDLGDIEAYHETFFGSSGSSTATIDDVFPHAAAGPNVWNEAQINAYLGGTKVVGVHDEWYKKGRVTASGVYVRSKMEKYIKKLLSSKGLSKYKGGYFDYLVMNEPVGDETLPTLVRRLTLNLDLTYLANHETLVGDIEQAMDGKIVKESDLTNVVTYLISGMNVATCDISPSKGYLDFLKKTIGNPEVFNPARKFEGNVTLPGILGYIINGAEDIKTYSLYTSAKVKFKYNNKTKKEKMGILDTTACEVVVLEGTKASYTGKYGEEVYQYYIVLNDPVDTDRLLWAMFVSDAAKTVTYEGIFNGAYQAYQGSYYDVYSIFEPLNAEIEKSFFNKFVLGLQVNKVPALSFAKYADAEQIRKYLYGLNQAEVEENDPYFKDLWNSVYGKSSLEQYRNLLTSRYLVDKNQSGSINYEDFTGVLNETYYTFHMRPLYKCDASIDLKNKHNLAHDGFGINGTENGALVERCLWHKIFPNDNPSDCDACSRKNGGYECNCDKSGVNCAEWASDWPPECPEEGCKKFAQRALHGKIKVEYVRDPKPEFAALITISEDEYKEKINVDIGSALAAVKGNDKVDLTTNYNRYGYGDNYDKNFTHETVVLPEESAFHDSDGNKRYYFSVYEFYGEYALGEGWEEIDNPAENFHKGNSDLIILDPDESKLKEFESMQEISEQYNRAKWQQWADAVSSGATVPADYRAVSILSALYKRKYYYHNLLNTDSLEAGMYDEENGYERPIASFDYDPNNPDKYEEEFDKNFTSDDAEDTAFYGNKMEGFTEDNNEQIGGPTSTGDAGDGEIEFERDDGTNSYFRCPNCDNEVGVSDAALEQLDNEGGGFATRCPHCGLHFFISEGPDIQVAEGH